MGEAAVLIGVDEALVQLTRSVSDEQAALQQANLNKANKMLGRDSAPTPESAELSRQAALHWMRHEAALKLLDDALGCGDLRPSIRKPDGTLIPLTSAEWRASPSRRDTLIGGVWIGSAGPAGLLEYDRMWVLLPEAAFRSWCERVRPPTKSNASASPDEKAPVELATSTSAVGENAPNSARKRSRKKTVRARPQQSRARRVLSMLFPNGYPTKEEFSNVDLLSAFDTKYKEFEKTEKPKSRLGKPSDATVLRETGRK